MEEDDTKYTPKRLLIDIDYRLEYEWIEFSYKRYTEKFVFPNNDIDDYDDIRFLFSYEGYDDEDFMFDLLCEEMDEIFSQ